MNKKDTARKQLIYKQVSRTFDESLNYIHSNGNAHYASTNVVSVASINKNM